MRTGLRAALIGLGLVTLGTSGCKRIQERLAERAADKAVEAATAGSVDAKTGSGSVTLKGEGGGVVAMGGDTVKLPDTWPAVIPAYPTGTLKGSMSLTGEAAHGKIHHSLTYETADEPSQILAYYAANLKGFTKTSELVLGGNVVASYEGDGKVVALTVSRAQNSKVSMLNVIVTNKT